MCHYKWRFPTTKSEILLPEPYLKFGAQRRHTSLTGVFGLAATALLLPDHAIALMHALWRPFGVKRRPNHGIVRIGSRFKKLLPL